MNLSTASAFANDVLSAFSHAQHLFTDPMFLARLIASGVEIASAPDDESRRGTAQMQLLILKREFS